MKHIFQAKYTFSQQACRLRDNFEKYDRERAAKQTIINIRICCNVA